MRINPETCIGCGMCIRYCPSNAISLCDTTAAIDDQLCTECSTCVRVKCCPVEAISRPEALDERRMMRHYFSDPVAHHPGTGVPGRGTEEVKTNDVTGRVKRGEVGIAIEVGRPILGTQLTELEKITTALAPLGIDYERNNPMTYLLESEETGKIKEEHRNERVTSIIVEFTIPEERLEEVLTVVKSVAGMVDTVFALDLVGCYDENGQMPWYDRVVKAGFSPRPNAKINLGFGRPAAPLYAGPQEVKAR